MRIVKNVFSQLHTYVVWALLSAVLWGWIFGMITDAPAEKKIVIYAQAAACRDTELDLALEENRPEGIRLIRFRTFDYAMFDEYSLLHADLYIVKASDMESYLDSFQPYAPGAFPLPGDDLWTRDGLAYGVRIYEAAADPVAGEYVTWLAPGEPPEDRYLCFGSASVHRPAPEGDGAAAITARDLLSMK